MNRSLLAAAMAIVAGGPAMAQITTQGQAFESGQSFANGVTGKGAAAGSVSTTSGTTNVPKYNTDPPEAGIFGDGTSLIGGAGSNKILGCENFTAANAYDQQECNAVNYLQQLRTERVPFVIDKNNDPLMVGSQGTIANPGTISATTPSACHIETTTIPGTYRTETCETSTVLTTIACNKTLVAQCGYIGTAISSHAVNRSGAFTSVTLAPTGTPGLYDYKLEVPYRNCGGEGVGEITFNLDTVGYGSYITINLSNLDDSAAIGVNGTTVFAGYPNNGPQYSGNLFPTSAQDFQVGYAWQEERGTMQCVATDGDGNCTQQQFVSNMQTLHADTKLLDYCPGGYSAHSSTPDGITGFFCNSEGKFLMNRHEGDGTWGGSVSSQMPLKTGQNRISVYWGTEPYGGACGNVKVSGKIYNVAPGCSSSWDDQCAGPRGAVAH